MKKIISCLVAVCMVAMSFVTVHCEDNIKVILDGKTLEFDVQPQIIDERTLVPMRVIFEALGADVEWKEETQTINARRSDTDLFYISMRVGDKIIHKETVKENLPTSNDIELDVPPMIIDGRTLVPVRAVSECFGCKVEWDGESQTVIIESNSDNNTDTDVPTPSPTETPVNSVNTIEYNADNEQYASYMKEFKILDAVKNSDGNYDITYTLPILKVVVWLWLNLGALMKTAVKLTDLAEHSKAQIIHGALKRRKQQFPVKQHALSL